MLYSTVSLDRTEQERVIALVGPTAVGKTAVGMELAALLEGAAEIISVDSVQVYRHLDIGSAKPTPEERGMVPFHLIDVVDPDEDFTVADFQRLAADAQRGILAQGSTALLVGGTGLYFRAISTRLDIPHTPPDPEFRARWQAVATEQGATALRDYLMSIDADAALAIHPNDVRRMIRAIEVFEKTGKPLSQWHLENRQEQSDSSSATCLYCLDRERDELYRAIDQRVDEMVEKGLIDEVETLRARGYDSSLKSMQTLGYRQINAFLNGELSRQEAIDDTKTVTKQFARRQLIWFRGDKRLEWVHSEGQTARQMAERIFTSVKNK